MIVISDEPFGEWARSLAKMDYSLTNVHMSTEHTPSGKIIKGELRKVARRHWEDRRRNGTGREPLANL